MKYLLSFMAFFAAVTLTSITPAFAAKSEPAPISNEDQEGSNIDENAPGSFEESYEGNDRQDDEFDGIVLFNGTLTTKPIKQVTEDRGATIVVTTTRPVSAYEGDECNYITIQVIEKKSGEVLKSSTINTCDQQIL
jgi:hypothetical protein